MPLFSSIRSQSAFTLIEVLIAILIFSLGLIAAFILTSTATSLSMRSKQEIIATNLLREQLEIAKNIRDTNFLALRKYNSLEGAIAPCSSSGCSIMTPGYWVLGTRYDSVQAPIFAKAIVSPLLLSVTASSSPPIENAHKWIIIAEAAESPGNTIFRYCLDSLGRYRQGAVCGLAGMTPTPYYGWILVRPLVNPDSTSPVVATVTGGMMLTAYFATTEGVYRELSMSTILTDFKK